MRKLPLNSISQHSHWTVSAFQCIQYEYKADQNEVHFQLNSNHYKWWREKERERELDLEGRQKIQTNFIRPNMVFLSACKGFVKKFVCKSVFIEYCSVFLLLFPFAISDNFLTFNTEKSRLFHTFRFHASRKMSKNWKLSFTLKHSTAEPMNKSQTILVDGTN